DRFQRADAALHFLCAAPEILQHALVVRRQPVTLMLLAAVVEDDPDRQHDDHEDDDDRFPVHIIPLAPERPFAAIRRPGRRRCGWPGAALTPATLPRPCHAPPVRGTGWTGSCRR